MRRWGLILAALAGLTSCTDNQNGAGQAAGPAAEEELSPVARKGRAAFLACSSCHTVREGAPSRVGPNLFAIVGAPAARLDEFAYSKALAGSGLVWTEDNLDAFIENPGDFLPGNRMAYPGEPDEPTRAALIEYLKTFK